jgi:hypothetical protein
MLASVAVTIVNCTVVAAFPVTTDPSASVVDANAPGIITQSQPNWPPAALYVPRFSMLVVVCGALAKKVS